MKDNNASHKGFTLVELLLVMVIITAIIMMSTSYMQRKAVTLRIDKTALQMQEILNAAVAYYAANGTWPGTLDSYQCTGCGSFTNSLSPNYLSLSLTVNPWGQSYVYYYADFNYLSSPANTFSVMTFVPGSATQSAEIAGLIAGKLPMGFTTAMWPLGGTGTSVVGFVNIPSQNLNSAMSVKFAGLYHHGACVPVPTCPTVASGGGTTTLPQIFVMPVSVSGVNDTGSGNVYPLSSFTAYSTAMGTVGGTPVACPGGTAVACAPTGGPLPSNQYWRVCLQVITERGDVQATRADVWGNRVTLAAFTRCGINNEPGGSTFGVYTH